MSLPLLHHQLNHIMCNFLSWPTPVLATHSYKTILEITNSRKEYCGRQQACCYYLLTYMLTIKLFFIFLNRFQKKFVGQDQHNNFIHQPQTLSTSLAARFVLTEILQCAQRAEYCGVNFLYWWKSNLWQPKRPSCTQAKSCTGNQNSGKVASQRCMQSNPKHKVGKIKYWLQILLWPELQDN